MPSITAKFKKVKSRNNHGAANQNFFGSAMLHLSGFHICEMGAKEDYLISLIKKGKSAKGV